MGLLAKTHTIISYETNNFIAKWGFEMVPIDIKKAIYDIERNVR